MPSQKRDTELISPAGQVASELREHIRSGNYRVGQRLDNERRLASAYGISRGTVRQALKILEQERLIIRQQGRGTFVADAAYAGNATENATILAIMVYEKEYYFGGVLQSAAVHATERGFLLTTGSNTDHDSELSHVEAFISGAVKGVILAPRPEHSIHAYDILVAHQIPVVILDAPIPDRTEDMVRIDNVRGAQLATRHLIELGHRRLAYIGHEHPEQFEPQWERFSGFLATCRCNHIHVPDSWCLHIEQDGIDSAMEKLLDRPDRPTGIVAYNDIWAVGVIKACQKMGIRVPDQLSVTGFDNSTLAKKFEPAITTISTEPAEQGLIAVDALIDKINQSRNRPKQTITIQPRLIPARSTAEYHE